MLINNLFSLQLNDEKSYIEMKPKIKLTIFINNRSTIGYFDEMVDSNPIMRG